MEKRDYGDQRCYAEVDGRGVKSELENVQKSLSEEMMELRRDHDKRRLKDKTEV